MADGGLLGARNGAPHVGRVVFVSTNRWGRVLCDDYDLVSGPTGSPLVPLVDLFALGRDIGLHVVIARRVGGSARGAYEPVFSRVRELRAPGVILSGDPGEGPLLGGLKAHTQPPDRGTLVQRGRRPMAVQLALARHVPLALPSAQSTHHGGGA